MVVIGGICHEIGKVYENGSQKKQVSKTILVNIHYGHFSNPKNVQTRFFFIKSWGAFFLRGSPDLPFQYFILFRKERMPLASNWLQISM